MAHLLVHCLTGDHCANEGQECSCYGNVIFGRDQTWSKGKHANGKIMCTRSVFGDPVPGVKKECLCTPKGK